MLPKPITIHGQELLLRDATVDDVDFIFSSWMDCARTLRQTRLSVFNRFYPDVVRGLLETELAVVLTRAGSDAIHAWACGRPPNLLHFAYVPKNLQRAGFGHAVIEAVLDGYPQTVYVTSSPLALPHHQRFVYNPFIVRTA